MPWFILVPDTSIGALYQMPALARVVVEEEWNTLSAWVHKRFECTRVNMAAIGNMVPQLHLHVVGRHEGDPCWPGVVWGQELPKSQWQQSVIVAMTSELGAECGLR